MLFYGRRVDATYLEGLDNPREPVLPPAMPQGDRECDGLRPPLPWDAIEIANELREEVVRVSTFVVAQRLQCRHVRMLRRLSA